MSDINKTIEAIRNNDTTILVTWQDLTDGRIRAKVSECEALQAENAELREALGHYAKPEPTGLLITSKSTKLLGHKTY